MLSDYGFTLTDEERTAFNLNNFNIQFVNQEAVVSLDFTKSIVKKDQFYSNFFEFLKQPQEISNLNFNYEFYQITTKPDFHGQLIFFNSLEYFNKIVLLNSVNPFKDAFHCPEEEKLINEQIVCEFKD